MNSRQQSGIRTRVRVMERAAFFTAWREKEMKGIIAGGTAAQGNAAARLEAFAITVGYYADGGMPILMNCSGGKRRSATASSAKICCMRSSDASTNA